MSKILNLFKKSLPVSNDAVVVYLILRSDVARNETITARLLKKNGKLVSGLDVQSIARRSKLSDLGVISAINDLKRVGWVKTLGKSGDVTFQLGTVSEFEANWFIEEEKEEPKKEVTKEHSVVTQIRQLASEQRKRSMANRVKIPTLSSKAKQQLAADSLGGLIRPEKASTTLLKYLETEIKEKLGKNIDYDPRTKYVYMGRLLTWCKEDVDSAKAVIDWAISNWSDLKEVLKVHADFPTLNILSTKSIFERINKYIVSGIPEPTSYEKKDTTGMATRANKDEIKDAKEAGW